MSIDINFTLDELRVIAKSVSKTRDAELKKLSRLKQGTHVHTEVRTDYATLAEVDAKVAEAIEDLVVG